MLSRVYEVPNDEHLDAKDICVSEEDKEVYERAHRKVKP